MSYMYELKEVHFEITNMCPHTCRHCSTGTIDRKDLQHLSLFEAKETMDQLEEVPGSPKIVHLTGGEPLCHPDIAQIISYIKNKSFIPSVFTTGFTAAFDNKGKHAHIASVSIMKRIVQAGLQEAVFSVHSVRSEVQDDILQTKGAFAQQIFIMKFLVENDVKVKINSVPMAVNYAGMEEVVEWARDHWVSEVRFLRFVPQGNAAKDKELHITKQQMHEIAENVKKLSRKYGTSYFKVVTEGHPQFAKCRPFEFMGEGCQAGIALAHINLNRDVLGCPAFKQKKAYFGGNLRNSSLLEIWGTSPVFGDLRKAQDKRNLSDPCYSCKAWAMCGGGCTAQRSWEHESVFASPDPICLLNE